MDTGGFLECSVVRWMNCSAATLGGTQTVALNMCLIRSSSWASDQMKLFPNYRNGQQVFCSAIRTMSQSRRLTLLKRERITFFYLASSRSENEAHCSWWFLILKSNPDVAMSNLSVKYGNLYVGSVCFLLDTQLCQIKNIKWSSQNSCYIHIQKK